MPPPAESKAQLNKVHDRTVQDLLENERAAQRVIADLKKEKLSKLKQILARKFSCN